MGRLAGEALVVDAEDRKVLRHFDADAFGGVENLPTKDVVDGKDRHGAAQGEQLRAKGDVVPEKDRRVGLLPSVALSVPF